jgi:hypothetical protein
VAEHRIKPGQCIKLNNTTILAKKSRKQKKLNSTQTWIQRTDSAWAGNAASYHSMQERKKICSKDKIVFVLHISTQKIGVFVWNVSIHIKGYTVLQPKRLQFDIGKEGYVSKMCCFTNDNRFCDYVTRFWPSWKEAWVKLYNCQCF